MTDLLKLWIFDRKTIEQLKKNALLFLKEENEIHVKDRQTKKYNGELKTKITKTYEGIDFVFGKEYDKKEYVEIIFKPHYFYNSNLHNANDFSIKASISTIKKLGDLFKIDLNKARVMNLEFGVNVVSPICVRDLIAHLSYHGKNVFLNHKDLGFSKWSSSLNKHGKSNMHKIIKAYAKGLQFPEHCNKNTFRFEIKSNRTQYIKDNLNVTHASDLLKPMVYIEMANIIQSEFEEVLLLMNIDNKFLLSSEGKKLNKLLNPNQWYKFLQSSNRNLFRDKVKQFNKLVNKDSNNIKKQLTKQIKSKLIELQKGCIFKTPHKIKKDAYLTYSIVKIRTFSIRSKDYNSNPRICLKTDIDISMQKECSFLLSNTGLKHLEKTDKKKFDFLVKTLITGNHNEFEKDIYSKLSKQIRNRYYNNPNLGNTSQKKLF